MHHIYERDGHDASGMLFDDTVARSLVLCSGVALHGFRPRAVTRRRTSCRYSAHSPPDLPVFLATLHRCYGTLICICTAICSWDKLQKLTHKRLAEAQAAKERALKLGHAPTASAAAEPHWYKQLTWIGGILLMLVSSLLSLGVYKAGACSLRRQHVDSICDVMKLWRRAFCACVHDHRTLRICAAGKCGFSLSGIRVI